MRMGYIRLLTALCVLGSANGAAAEVTLAEGTKLFEENCAACHGPDARGGGVMAGSLRTKPADLTKIAARRDGVWPMLEVMSIIDGYTREFDSREDMPVLPQIGAGRMMDFDTGNGQITRVPARLVALVNYLESIQDPRPERYVP